MSHNVFFIDTNIQFVTWENTKDNNMVVIDFNNFGTKFKLELQLHC